MAEEGNPVLLFPPVSGMTGYAGFDTQGHDNGAFG